MVMNVMKIKMIMKVIIMMKGMKVIAVKMVVKMVMKMMMKKIIKVMVVKIDMDLIKEKNQAEIL